MGYIDAHVHVWTPDTAHYPLAAGYKREEMKPPSFTPEELFKHAKPAGVDRINLIQMSFYGFDNSYMLVQGPPGAGKTYHRPTALCERSSPPPHFPRTGNRSQKGQTRHIAATARHPGRRPPRRRLTVMAPFAPPDSG